VDLRTVVEACLVKAPEERPANARAIADTLNNQAGRMPLSSLPAHVSSEPCPTRALPVVPAPGGRRADVRERAQRHTASRRRPAWGWLALPLLAALVWGAFALGSLFGAPEPASQRGPVSPPSAVVPSVSTPTTATTTAPTTAVTTSERQQAEPADARPSQGVAPAERTHPGKGKGKGKK
jgi:serine/threonine-protein kinase